MTTIKWQQLNDNNVDNGSDSNGQRPFIVDNGDSGSNVNNESIGNSLTKMVIHYRQWIHFPFSAMATF